MCGFLISYSNSKRPISKEKILSCAKLIEHRGPDGSGYYFSSSNGVKFQAVHKRLSILDLSELGHQPMVSVSTGNVLVFNGEVYNYVEIRETLRSKGYIFKSDSDTEVLLYALEEWGKAAIARLNGMFSFAYLDKSENRLIVARDAFGIKPLYYHSDSKGVIFCSEISPILAMMENSTTAANTGLVGKYLSDMRLTAGNETFFEDVFSFPPGHVGEVNLDVNEKLSVETWTKSSHSSSNKDLNFNDAKARLRCIFENQIREHIRSDVPIAITLSGGVDSTLIAALLRRLYPKLEIVAFTFDSQSDNSELNYAEYVSECLGITLHKVTFGAADLLSEFSNILAAQEEPFVSPSIIAQYFVYKKINEMGYKVVLGGQGADEIFCGYTGYPYQATSEFLNVSLYKGLKFSCFNYLKFGGAVFKSLLVNMESKYLRISIKRLLQVPVKFYRSWREGTGGPKSALSRFKYFISQTKIPSRNTSLAGALSLDLHDRKIPILLRYDDKSSMHFGIESRVPFLNNELSNFALNLPFNFLISERSVTKFIMRETFKDIIPVKVYNRFDKIGFEASHDFIKVYARELTSILNSCNDISVVSKIDLIERVNSSKVLTQAERSHIWRCINVTVWADQYAIKI